MKYKSKANRTLLFSLISLTSFAHAENAMLVLDASGSMWGTLQNQSKIEIARATVADVLKTWPRANALGLVAYGHRRKGDCADIETLLPIAPVNAAAFQASVDALNPKGMTPISAAVQHAAQALKSSEQKATVILVSDGEESCNLDPCQIARQLEADGIDFTAHVIGFDIPQDGVADKQLACIAKETGGRYVNAKNASELTSALGQMAQVKPDVNQNSGPLGHVYSTIDWGDLTITEWGQRTFAARYTHEDGGVITASRADKQIDGYWTQSTSAQRCDSQKDGSYYYGRMTFSFDPSMESFAGQWGYCGEVPDKSWNGNLTRRASIPDSP